MNEQFGSAFWSLVSVIVSYVFYVRSKPRYSLSRISWTYGLVGDTGRRETSDDDSLVIETVATFDGRKVGNLNCMVTLIWNDGNVLISEHDIHTNDPLRFSFSEGQKVLRVELFAHEREKALVDAALHKDEVVVQMQYLEARRGFIVRVFFEGPCTKPRIRGKIRNILDVSPHPLRKTYHPMYDALSNPFLIMLPLLVAASCATLLKFYYQSDPPAIAIMLSCVSMFLLLLLLTNSYLGERPPRYLRKIFRSTVHPWMLREQLEYPFEGFRYKSE